MEFVMQITGIWHMFVRPPFGQDPDWSLPVVEFRDGKILLGDGDRPDFTNKRGVLRFSYAVENAASGRRVANILIDRGSDGHMQGWRALSDAPLPDFPDPENALSDRDRFARLELIREDKFAAFKAEQEGFASAQKRVLAEAEEAEEAEEADAAPVTVH
jgi:hypothetical protein